MAKVSSTKSLYYNLTRDRLSIAGVDDNPLNRVIREFEHFALSPQNFRVMPEAGLGVINPLQCLFSYALPTDLAFQYLQEVGPIVEYGAGRGYFSYLLRQLGVDVVAYDQFGDDVESIDRDTTEPVFGFDRHMNDLEAVAPALHEELQDVAKPAYTKVESADPDVVGDHTDRTLLLVWPDDIGRHAPNPTEVVEEYLSSGGKAIIYIGEGPGGTHANSRFFQVLNRQDGIVPRTLHTPLNRVTANGNYIYSTDVYMKNWCGYADSLQIYKHWMSNIPTTTGILEYGLHEYVSDGDVEEDSTD